MPREVYDLSLVPLCWAAPLRSLTRAAQDILWGLSVGWQNCEESAQEWWDYLNDGPDWRFFAQLGEPLDGMSQHKAAWDEYRDSSLLRELEVL